MRRNLKKAVTGVYLGIPYDSLEEMAFLQWANELKIAGYILSIERAESFLLCDAMQINYAQQLVTKSKPMQQTILHGHSYTPEFKILWANKAAGKITQHLNVPKKMTSILLGTPQAGGSKCETYIEIKPLFDQNNMERLFKLNQKWMWDKHKVFVNLIKCPELFEESFTPKEYLITRTGKKRLIKWKVKSVQSFLRT